MVNVAILGYGTVGSGVFKIINDNNSHIARRAGDDIKVKYVLDLRDFPGDPVEEVLVHDVDVIMEDEEVSVVVEVMGGVEPAHTFEVKALKAGDIEHFGQLMRQSHESLRDDYDVTGVELDTLAEEAWKIPGVIGSRMTGGGFGGCTVSIVKDEAVENFKKTVGENYLKKIGYEATFYTVEIGAGPEVV